MAKTVSCKDVGSDCDFVAHGANEEELMQQVADHARKEHNMSEIPADVREKLHAAIRDEAA